jgi:hypothetical protein
MTTPQPGPWNIKEKRWQKKTHNPAAVLLELLGPEQQPPQPLKPDFLHFLFCLLSKRKLATWELEGKKARWALVHLNTHQTQDFHEADFTPVPLPPSHCKRKSPKTECLSFPPPCMSSTPITTLVKTKNIY